ncbi:FKBP-type peptidyl-prolyl cis-trans isomerase [Flavobacterium sp.]|uniref:FKBP-type peptidyl-prolyl cis-trans isomerase n=1 Tax=Flavobacterium sp. TaxID=239 RepID=UPI0040483851
MKSLFKLVLVLGLFNGLYSCQNDSGTTITEDRPYDEVYLEDIAEIEDFLDTHYVTVDADYNTTFTQIPDGGTQTPISNMPELEFKEVEKHDITYKVYYLNLREGSGESITKVDSSFVSYKGFNFSKTTVDSEDTYSQTVFDSKQSPVWLSLDELIIGWTEIVPLFKTGTYMAMPDGTISYDNFGVGVMFIPSGLAYFSSGSLSIPSYTPIVFNFKLYNLRRRDHDRDGILSMYEYGPNFVDDAIDTDGDGRPDYIDVDDDGDGVLTTVERSFTYLDGTETKTGYYPFNGALVDDPTTPYDDTKGIPSCSNDFTTATRLRRHLDPTCRN